MLDTEEYPGLIQLLLFLGWQAIEWVFNEMVELASKRNCQLLNKEMLVQRLNFLGRENMKKLKESEVRLSKQICSLQQITAELERKCRQPASVLLQVRVWK